MIQYIVIDDLQFYDEVNHISTTEDFVNSHRKVIVVFLYRLYRFH